MNINKEEKSSLRVLFIASDNNISSGAFRSMVKLCEILRDTSIYEPVVVLRKKGTGEQLLISSKIRFIYIRSFNWIVKISKRDNMITACTMLVKKVLNKIARHRLERVISNEDIRIVHINTSFSYIGALAAIDKGIPYIWHIRELLEEDQNRCFYFSDYAELINKANRIIYVSDYVMRKYINIFDPQRGKVTYNGIDEIEYYIKRDFTETKKGKNIEFLSVASMGNPQKGQGVIIKSIVELKKQCGKKFHVSFVGGGELETEYKNMVNEFGLDGYVTFYGKRKDVREFYRKADVFIMSSEAEAFGRTTVEALMSGCLVIGSDSGATPEILQYGDNGILYNNRNSIDLADKMRMVITSGITKYKSIIENGQQYALDHFTAKQNAKAVVNVYDELLKNESL